MNVLDLKADIFKVPSLGLAYEPDMLLNGDSVKIRPFVAGDQRHLAKQNDSYRGYFCLLSRLVLQPEKFPIDELLMGDVNAMLFAVRLRSYGPQYDVEFRCEMCGAKNHQQADLNAIMVKQADEFDVFRASGLEINLQDASGDEHKVTVKLPRLKDEKRLAESMKSLKAKGNRVSDDEIDRTYVRLAQAIETIDETKPVLVQAFDFIDNLPPQELEKLGEFLSDSDIGLMKDQTLNCDSCSFENKITLAISADFFRPTRVRKDSD